MPNYGYRCQTCQREFEMLQRMSDPPQAACPECGGTGTRLFYPTGILFKGSGFYKTDSRSSSAAPAAGTDGAKPGTDGGGDAAKPAPPAKDAPAPSPASAPTTTPPAAKPAVST